jgi:hypothetical protein
MGYICPSALEPSLEKSWEHERMLTLVMVKTTVKNIDYLLAFCLPSFLILKGRSRSGRRAL